MSMSKEQLLDTLKKDVRSLLISAKAGLAPEHLKRDYTAMLGHPLPLQRLGFCSVLDMAVHMPDVVCLESTKDGSTMLKAIGVDSTKGIEELVAKQRDSKPKAFKKKAHCVGSQAPVLLHRRGNPPPSLPASLRVELRQLLVHGPLRLSELELQFATRFSRPLQISRYGFRSISEVLRAAEDMIEVKQSRTGSVLSLKRSKMAARVQPLHDPGTVSCCVCVVVTVKNSTGEDTASRRTAKEEKGLSASQLQSTPSMQQSPAISQDEKEFERHILKLEENLKNTLLDCVQAGTINPQLKEKLRQVVSQKPEGVLVQSLPGEFKKMFGEDLPVSQCGFLSVTDLVSSLSDTLHLTMAGGENNNQLIVMDIEQMEALQQKKTSPGSQACASFQSLNPSNRNISFSDISQWEKNVLGLELDQTVGSESGLRFMTKALYQKLDMLHPMLPQVEEPKIPPDAMQSGCLQPAARRQEETFVPVLVEKVVSPSQFYIRFSDTHEARALENMMFQMRCCYSSPEVAKRYQMPEPFVRVGQVGCVAPSGLWFYRVVIHRIVSDLKVEVYCVDFGGLNCVEKSNLKFLKLCYSTLPAQAVPSTLTWIKPSQGSWSEGAVGYFKKLCCERPMIAVIYCYMKDVLHLFLCDTHTSEDLYIHNAMKMEGYAIPCSVVEIGEPFRQFNPVVLYLRAREQLDSPITDSPEDDILTIFHSRLSQKQQITLEDSGASGSSQTLKTKSSALQNEVDFSDLPELEFDNNLESRIQEPLECINEMCSSTECQQQTGSRRTSFSAQSTPDINNIPQKEDGRDYCHVPKELRRDISTLIPLQKPQRWMFPIFRGDSLRVDKQQVPQTSTSTVLGPAARLACSSHHLDWSSCRKV
ncbi:tudor domain-containing protein 5 isoform X2 [Lepisosteus oculatus]|uniref:tudor domain-containing protein 5 isoform X2 n=1 Tax=Lepisosteus oculatus TaxID=7918 RepID=UPI00073FAD5D|nr:PREDICTED: tudor domain-containing protein 5 isoform X2 [Lepisosteus oculatus]